MARRPIITIFGSSRAEEDSDTFQTAYNIGYVLGKAGWQVCNGGYGGTMLASAKGCKDAGGRTIGIICKIFPNSQPNEYIDEVIVTEDLFERLNYLIWPARGFIVLPGSSGTLVELALVWELTAKRIIERKPIILIGNFWQAVLETASHEKPSYREYITIIQENDIERIPSEIERIKDPF